MKNIKVPVTYVNGVQNGKSLEQYDEDIARHTLPTLAAGDSEAEKQLEKQDEQPPKKSFCKKWKTDKLYRAKFLHTLCLFWAFVNLGWIIGQFGPSFLDLQVITGTRLEEGSAFMTAHSVGYLIGSLVSGLLFDRFNKILLIFSSIFGNAVTIGIIPWCSRYELMIVIHWVKGLFSGSLDAVGNAELVYVWGDTGRSFMQTLHFCFAFGGILSPLATAPFLSPKREPRVVSHFSNSTATVLANSNNVSNGLSNIYSTNSVTSLINITTQNMTETVEWVKPQNSMIYIAYFITSGLALSAALPFLVTFFRSRNTNLSATLQNRRDKNEQEMSFKSRCLILLNMCVLIGTYSAIEDTFAGFLTTFCVEQMDWSKTDGSYATSIYWASFGAGRFFGIVLVKFCSPVRMITMYCSLLILSFIGLFFTSFASYDDGVWICASLAGLAMSIIFPTIFTWTEAEVLPVTGKVASLFLIGSSSGTMVNPIVLGFLMDELTPMWFCYLLLGESVVLLTLFLSALFLSKHIKESQYTAYRDVVIEIKEEEEPVDIVSLLEPDHEVDLQTMPDLDPKKRNNFDDIAFADEEKKKSYEQLNNNNNS